MPITKTAFKKAVHIDKKKDDGERRPKITLLLKNSQSTFIGTAYALYDENYLKMEMPDGTDVADYSARCTVGADSHADVLRGYIEAATEKVVLPYRGGVFVETSEQYQRLAKDLYVNRKYLAALGIGCQLYRHPTENTAIVAKSDQWVVAVIMPTTMKDADFF